MDITYKNKIDTESQEPEVTLSCNGEHIGTIWGIACQNTNNEFEQRHGIVSIRQDDKVIAYLWNCKENTITH